MTPLKIIREARRIIQDFITDTPVLQSSYLNDKYRAKVLFKCENFQDTGSFKLRGAFYSSFKKTTRTGKVHLAGHSSGNFAQALAKSARLMNLKATIVMPRNAPTVKIEGVKNWGAEIVFSGNTPLDRERRLEEYLDQNPDAVFLHPSNDMDMICGNATCAMEFLEDKDNLEVLIAPVGGGGILAGTALAAKYLKPDVKVYGAEPSGADDAARSFRSGKIVPSINPDTIADGLRTQLGDINFPIIQDGVINILTVNDEEIVAAMKDIYQYLKIVIEPSSAVPLAVVKRYPDLFEGKTIGLIITGGNIDLVNLAQIFK